jgi:hypothetical protein
MWGDEPMRRTKFQACRRCDQPAVFRLGLTHPRAEFSCGGCLGYLTAWLLTFIENPAVHVRVHLNPETSR